MGSSDHGTTYTYDGQPTLYQIIEQDVEELHETANTLLTHC